MVYEDNQKVIDLMMCIMDINVIAIHYENDQMKDAYFLKEVMSILKMSQEEKEGLIRNPTLI